METRRYDASLNECPDLYSLHNLPFSPYFARIVWNFISMAASKFSRSSFCPRMVSSPLMFDPLTCKLSRICFQAYEYLWQGFPDNRFPGCICENLFPGFITALHCIAECFSATSLISLSDFMNFFSLPLSQKPTSVKRSAPRVSPSL